MSATPHPDPHDLTSSRSEPAGWHRPIERTCRRQGRRGGASLWSILPVLGPCDVRLRELAGTRVPAVGSQKLNKKKGISSAKSGRIFVSLLRRLSLRDGLLQPGGSASGLYSDAPAYREPATMLAPTGWPCPLLVGTSVDQRGDFCALMRSPRHGSLTVNQRKRSAPVRTSPGSGPHARRYCRDGNLRARKVLDMRDLIEAARTKAALSAALVPRTSIRPNCSSPSSAAKSWRAIGRKPLAPHRSAPRCFPPDECANHFHNADYASFEVKNAPALTRSATGQHKSQYLRSID